MPVHNVRHSPPLYYHTDIKHEPSTVKASLESQHKGRSWPFEKRQFIKCCLAIEGSWNADFIDLNPLIGLRDHIGLQLSNGRQYGRYCSIVQSSGMGKSRLLDEFSKHYFMIPMNLRAAISRGLSYRCYLQGLLNLS